MSKKSVASGDKTGFRFRMQRRGQNVPLFFFAFDVASAAAPKCEMHLCIFECQRRQHLKILSLSLAFWMQFAKVGREKVFGGIPSRNGIIHMICVYERDVACYFIHARCFIDVKCGFVASVIISLEA